MGILAELVKLIGEERTRALCAREGGHEVYIPEVPTHHFNEILGEDLARVLCSAHPGERLYIPKGGEWDESIYWRRVSKEAQEGRDIVIRRLRGQGLTVWELAKRFDLTRTRIYMILGEKDCGTLDTRTPDPL